MRAIIQGEPVQHDVRDKNSPLSSCKISGIDGLRGDHPPANTTVFLTLSCPSSNN